jgi:hypothetical protein
LSENGSGPQEQPVWAQTIIHDCVPSVEKMGEMTLFHMDVPNHRYTLKLVGDKAIDAVVTALRGIEIRRSL